MRTISSSALGYAVEGVIPAAAIGLANGADGLEAFARTRARSVMAEAQRQADDCRHQAIAEGYARGYAEALEAFVPRALDLLRQESALKDAVLAKVRQALRETLLRLDVEAPLIARWCELHTAAEEAELVLHLPVQREDLATHLRQMPALSRLDIRLGDAAFPVLEAGSLVFEFDPERLLLRESEPILGDATLLARIERCATDYAQDLLSRLHADECQQRYATLGGLHHENS